MFSEINRAIRDGAWTFLIVFGRRGGGILNTRIVSADQITATAVPAVNGKYALDIA
jgi:hypothetical protein